MKGIQWNDAAVGWLAPALVCCSAEHLLDPRLPDGDHRLIYDCNFWQRLSSADTNYVSVQAYQLLKSALYNYLPVW